MSTADRPSDLGRFVQAFLKYLEQLRSSPAHLALVRELAKTIREATKQEQQLYEEHS